MRLHNLPGTTKLRAELRKRLTPAEATLWKHLQRGQLAGRKFRRQHGVGPYILDFFCASEHLAIELDGAAHDHDAAQVRDHARDSFLASAGLRMLRFENRDVIDDPECVLAEIARHFRSTT